MADKEVRLGRTAPMLYEFIHKPSKEYAGAVPVVSVENITPDNIRQILEEGKLKSYFFDEGDENNEYKRANLVGERTRTIIFSGASKTKWGQIQEVLDKFNNGPYYSDARDGVMHIHNMMVNRPVSRIYTFAGGNGELLYARIKSKFTLNYAEMSQTSDINGDTKEGETVISQNASNPDPGLYVFLPEKLKGVINFAQDNTRVQKYGDMTPYMGGYMDPNSTSPVVDSTPVFNSKEDAVSYYQNNPQLTKEEFDQLVQQIMDRYKRLNNPQTESDLDHIMHDWNYWDDFRIKRKVKIKKRLNPRDYGGFGQPGPISSSNTSSISYNRGIENLKKQGYQIIGYSQYDPSTKGYKDWNLYESRDADLGGDTILVIVISEEEVEVPLHAVHVFASMPISTNSSIQLGNDLQKSLEGQIKMDATFIGNPFLESSQNILIQNISSKYSGVWYSKKVKHSFSNSNGYTCEVEFVERNIPMMRSVIKAKINTQNFVANLNKEALKSIETGDYSIPAKAQAVLKQVIQDNGLEGKNVLIKQDTRDPSKFTIKVAAEEDTVFSNFVSTDDDHNEISVDINDLSFSPTVPGINTK